MKKLKEAIEAGKKLVESHYDLVGISSKGERPDAEDIVIDDSKGLKARQGGKTIAEAPAGEHEVIAYKIAVWQKKSNFSPNIWLGSGGHYELQQLKKK